MDRGTDMPWVARGREIDLSRPVLMGIVNATPDSFSDGGQALDPDDAARRAMRLVADGAGIIDIGAESTRPGAGQVPEDEEARRLFPVLEAVRRAVGVPISIDTRRSGIAARALELGADIVNDVSALEDPGMARVVAESGAGLVIMHGYSEHLAFPSGNPAARCGIGDVVAFLRERVAVACNAGIPRSAIAVDPGFGFGKSNAESAAILRGLAQLRTLGLPIVAALSRKRFLADLPEASAAKDRDEATRVALGLAVAGGASILRVHVAAGFRPPPRPSRLAGAIRA